MPVDVSDIFSRLEHIRAADRNSPGFTCENFCTAVTVGVHSLHRRGTSVLKTDARTITCEPPSEPALTSLSVAATKAPRLGEKTRQER
jgi:hypothetical protein